MFLLCEGWWTLNPSERRQVLGNTHARLNNSIVLKDVSEELVFTLTENILLLTCLEKNKKKIKNIKKLLKLLNLPLSRDKG